jgi:hypothetical protein
MADFTASTGLRDYLQSLITPQTNLFAFATLHGSAATLGASTVYASSGLSEIAAVTNGYTAGSKTVALTEVAGGTYDAAATTWTQSGANNIGPARFCAIWCNTTNSITGAWLLCVDDAGTDQTASGGGTISFPAKTAIITLPTPA